MKAAGMFYYLYNHDRMYAFRGGPSKDDVEKLGLSDSTISDCFVLLLCGCGLGLVGIGLEILVKWAFGALAFYFSLMTANRFHSL